MHQMEVDLSPEPIFLSRHRMPRKMQKLAEEDCIFLPQKIVGLSEEPQSLLGIPLIPSLQSPRPSMVM